MEQAQNPLLPENGGSIILALSVGGLSVLLGLVVVISWHTDNLRFLQSTPTLASIAYNIALIFLLSDAVGLLAVIVLAQKERHKTNLLNEINQVLRREIAQHQQTEEALRKQTDIQRTIFACMSEDVIVADAQGKILVMNRAAQQTLGVSLADAATDAPVIDWSQLAPIYLPDQQTPFPAEHLPLVRALRGEVVNDCEQFILHPGASEGMWRSVNGQPLRDAEGRVCGGITVGRNITERKRTDEALQKQTEILHSILNNMADGVVLADENEKPLLFNPAAEHIFGQGVTDTKSDAWSQQYGLYLPDMKTPFPTEALPLTQAIRGTAVDKVEMFVCHANTREGTWIQVSGRPLKDRNGVVKGGVVVCRDITDRKQTEVALRESEERWQLALRGANDGLWDWNLKTNEVFFSQQWKAMLGFEEHEIANHVDEWARRVHPDDIGWVTQTLQDHFTQKIPFYLAEHRLLCKDGSYKWILARAQALWDAAGTAVRIVGSHTDTTERKQAEAALRESEERFRGAFDHAATGMALVAPDGRWLKANPSLCAIVGYPEQELLALDFQSITHPDDLEADLVQVRRVLAGEIQTYQMEKRYLHKRGHVVWGLLGVSLVRDAQGAPLYFVSQVQDISARKQAEAALRESEERFRSLCTASPVGIFQNDLTGACVYTNSRWQEMTGLTSEESLGQGWTKAIHPEDCEGVFTEWQASVALGRKFAKEFRFVRPTGEVCWVHSQASPLRSDDGIVIGYVGVNMDITDSKEVERMKDEFVSVVSHELRTPLTSIRGSLGLLASGRLGTLQEKGQRMLDIAVANTDRLVRLINDILDIERMQSGRATMVKVACDASEVMAQTVEVMQAIARKAEVTLSVQSQSVRLWADPDRLTQILANLLSNAIKFSPPGSQVWLTVERQKEHALFQIKDRGRGIPADKLDSIFERFQQVDASDSRDKGGTGLGLAICRSIVQQHGGHIWVESTLGEGSTFSFTLPALNSAETIAPEVSLPTAKRTVNGQRRTACVLVAEDDSDLVRVLVLMLQRYGIESFYAQTGREAIHLSQRLSPDLVILDLFMPDGDGFMVVNWLRQQNSLRHVPLIVYSAKDLDADERERLKLGPTQFFTKGRVNPEEFERRVIDFLNHILAQRAEGQNNGNQADFGR
jgi:PAS domain S-box-containing protein